MDYGKSRSNGTFAPVTCGGVPRTSHSLFWHPQLALSDFLILPNSISKNTRNPESAKQRLSVSHSAGREPPQRQFMVAPPSGPEHRRNAARDSGRLSSATHPSIRHEGFPSSRLAACLLHAHRPLLLSLRTCLSARWSLSGFLHAGGKASTSRNWGLVCRPTLATWTTPPNHSRRGWCEPASNVTRPRRADHRREGPHVGLSPRGPRKPSHWPDRQGGQP